MKYFLSSSSIKKMAIKGCLLLAVALSVFMVPVARFASTNRETTDIHVKSDVAELNLLIETKGRSSEVSEVKEKNNHIEIYTNQGVTFLRSNNEYIFKKMSDLPTENNIVLVYDKENRLQGVIGIPKVIMSNGDILYGKNTINDNSVSVSLPENVEPSEVDRMVNYVYIQRSFSYYFSGGNYDTRYYSEKGGYEGNFWMNPIESSFVSDEGRNLEVLAMSWDAVDNYFRGFSGSDYTKWVSNNNNLYKQYKCHYNFASRLSQWNLEEWRPDVSYAQIVAKGCNYY
ncbi:MAG: DUF2599 domain-containing protein [Oscillospiraceae bacterium]|nr:DUF2599 domain-containing protein [Oscillospiraceae bacterium]